jgi:peptide/nickel transport system substrate-binding protein
MMFRRAGCVLGFAALVAAVSCQPAERGASHTLVVAAVGEPPSVLPPLAYESVARDVGDLVWERLATLAPGGASVDTSAYQPGLAASWERVDSLTWRFHLRPDARWQDGQSVTAADVVFSFGAYADSVVDAIARPQVAPLQVTAQDSLTVLIRFPHSSPEQLYDATWHVRIIPKHIWGDEPSDAWTGDTLVSHLVGSGPFRVVSWRRGEALVLGRELRDAGRESQPSSRPAVQPSSIDTVVFRFTPDPDAALNLILSHEADVLEALMTPDRVARVEADSAYRVERYPSAVYGFLAFNVASGSRVLRDRAVRRALAQAVDRDAIARNAFGPDAHAPAGPISALAWIGEKGIDVLPFDSAAARRALAARPTSRGSRPSFDILVPSTSPSRRRIAEALQERWRQAGAEVTVTSVDFPVFQERLASGKFDSYIGAYLDEPTMRGLADQWGSGGFETGNFGHYASARFDSLVAAAAATGDTAVAGPLYREALSVLNEDAAAIFLYTPMSASAFRRDIGNVAIDPYSWLAGLPAWSPRP